MCALGAAPREIVLTVRSLFHLDDALLFDVHEEKVAYDGGDAEQGQARPDVEDRVLQVELAPAALDRQDELKEARKIDGEKFLCIHISSQRSIHL